MSLCISFNWRQLFYCPGLTGHDHVAERREVLAGANLSHLLLDFLVIDGRLHIAYHADGERERMAVHHSELLVEEVRLGVGIVNEHIVHCIALLADLYGFEQETVLYETILLVLAEEHLLAVHEFDHTLGAMLAVSDVVVYAVVPDHTVAEHFHHRCAGMLLGGGEHLLAGLKLYVDGAGKEVAACAKYELGRDKRVLGGAVGR